jgi:large subunit ribosomal protein L28
MSNRCDICGKGRMTGNTVSHSNRKARTVSQPNTQKLKAIVDGKPVRVRACTRCIRSGLVDKRTR